ncbi:hypothetical protein SAMN04487916_1088 [Arthrobacter sp. ov407]|uniref:hypothetical protein n=1 Tax=Arthrobacter sp. ov407 TaxID=1761748 RepID=UPI00087E2311|nr:hypothetical protein [Arthrobacter sp. ov407]SDL34813.1 hypothetical protein SAMN04487916_1088 [Arthrobacter sp. ov407]
MTFVVPAKMRWIVLGDETEAAALVDTAARDNGFRSRSSASGFLVEIPRSLRKRRPEAWLTGIVGTSEWGTEILWDCGTDTNRSYEHLLELEAAFPAGKIRYHGMVEASAAAGVVFDGIRAFRAVAAGLQPDERVLAVGQGQVERETCIVVLTDRRLLVLRGCLEAPPYLDARLETIKAVKLGKKRSGETLRIGAPPGASFVSHLGHGEGHAIAAGFRLRVEDLACSFPAFPAGVPGDTSVDDDSGWRSTRPGTRSPRDGVTL